MSALVASVCAPRCSSKRPTRTEHLRDKVGGIERAVLLEDDGEHRVADDGVTARIAGHHWRDLEHDLVAAPALVVRELSRRAVCKREGIR